MEERDATCSACGTFIARLLLRGSRAELDTPCAAVFKCQACSPVKIGSTSRKRASQLEDTTASTICDVCMHIQGHGGFAPAGRGVLSFLVEVVCASCLDKYRRCSNCGGGSARGGIGKWRCKELFENNRKTCSLSHARLGARDMELAVWALPNDLAGRKELPALLEACDTLWREHTLAKMAVPEARPPPSPSLLLTRSPFFFMDGAQVLEHQNGIKTYAEIDARVLQHGFSARPLFTQPPQSAHHRTYVALVWAKTRARRDRSRPEWAQSRAEDKSIADWVAYNTRRSTVLFPANSVLCGVWIAEWNIKDRTFSMSTICPFDYVDVEDRSPLAFGELLYRALLDARDHNAAHPEDPWEPPQHVWAAVKTDAYTLRMRLVETLERRLGFMPLEEYLTRYPGTTRAMFSPQAARMATLVDARDTGDGRDMAVVAKFLGGCLSLEAMDKVREAHLVRKPRVEAKFDD
ncbi:hypothetical protein DENSPDRAFT_807174 [Dentipellis sp. KUC8613]|nr:hypothetical protein DENSPDRAFT_807174 [Dentipellis sp. KUC8613]